MFHIIHIATLYHVARWQLQTALWYVDAKEDRSFYNEAYLRAHVALLALQLKMQIGSHRALRVN